MNTMEYLYLDDMDDVKWPPNGWVFSIGFSGAKPARPHRKTWRLPRCCDSAPAEAASESSVGTWTTEKNAKFDGGRKHQIW